MIYSTRGFVLCLALCYFVLVFFSPFSIAITSLGEERANFSAVRTFVRFALVWFCLFPLPFVWEGLRFVIVALLGLLSYLFVQTVESTFVQRCVPAWCLSSSICEMLRFISFCASEHSAHLNILIRIFGVR